MFKRPRCSLVKNGIQRSQDLRCDREFHIHTIGNCLVGITGLDAIKGVGTGRNPLIFLSKACTTVCRLSGTVYRWCTLHSTQQRARHLQYDPFWDLSPKNLDCANVCVSFGLGCYAYFLTRDFWAQWVLSLTHTVFRCIWALIQRSTVIAWYNGLIWDSVRPREAYTVTWTGA